MKAQTAAMTLFTRVMLMLRKGSTTLAVRVMLIARLNTLDQLMPGRAVTI